MEQNNYTVQMNYTLTAKDFDKLSNEIHKVINSYLKTHGFNMIQMTENGNLPEFIKLHNEILKRAWCGRFE